MGFEFQLLKNTFTLRKNRIVKYLKFAGNGSRNHFPWEAFCASQNLFQVQFLHCNEPLTNQVCDLFCTFLQSALYIYFTSTFTCTFRLSLFIFCVWVLSIFLFYIFALNLSHLRLWHAVFELFDKTFQGRDDASLIFEEGGLLPDLKKLCIFKHLQIFLFWNASNCGTWLNWVFVGFPYVLTSQKSYKRLCSDTLQKIYFRVHIAPWLMIKEIEIWPSKRLFGTPSGTPFSMGYPSKNLLSSEGTKRDGLVFTQRSALVETFWLLQTKASG